MRAGLVRPFRPLELSAGTLEFFRLPALLEALRGEDEYERSGVSALTLVRDASVTVVLVALRKGSVMREHRAPSAALVLLLSGRARFVATREEATTALEPGVLAACSADVHHAVEALDDAAYLVIIGGRDRGEAAS
jgi:quercetin dioxygenase-like cupin family protein